jgi:polyphosphate kinase
VPAASSPLPSDRFLNRELSWLDFNARVLELAEDDTLPLLERVKFLSIFASNLDEFFMVRIAGLKRRQNTGLSVRSPDGLTIREQLARVVERTQDLVHRHASVFDKDVVPRLEEHGIRIVHWSELVDADAMRLREYFRDQVFPVLTPLAVDPAHPFPYISGLSLNLAVSVRDPETGAPRFARLKVPNNVPRFIPVGPVHSTAVFLPLEDLIAAHLSSLFPGLDVIDHHLFRVTRNADLEVEEDRDEDLLQALERELAQRRFGPAVRLEVTETIDPQILDVLVHELEISPADVVSVPGPGPAGAEGRAVRAGHPSAAERGRDPQERVRHAARGRRAGPPPLRLLRHQRAALHRAGRRRPERAGDQADAVPHLR